MTARERELPGIYGGLRVLVTGGAGFIGSHLVDALVSMGADVTVLDDLSHGDTEFLASHVDAHPGRVRLVYGSILDPDALREAAEGRELCFHLAALASVPVSIEDPGRAHDVNATGTHRVAEACREVGVGRIVYASTSAVYGDPSGAASQMPRSEDELPSPLSPYASSKLAGEHTLASHAASYSIDTVSLRYFNVFGPRQRAGGDAAVVPAFIDRLQKGRACTIFGDGEATRDFVSVRDAVRANLLAGVHKRPLGGEAFNVGTGTPTSINRLQGEVAACMGREDAGCEHGPDRAGDVRHSFAQTERAESVLGFRAADDIESGLLAMLRAMGLAADSHAAG